MGQSTQIREHMTVVGSDNASVGVVDCVEGNRLKLTKDSTGGQHHFLPMDQVGSVTGDKVQLKCTAEEAKRSWQGESGMEQPGGGGASGQMAGGGGADRRQGDQRGQR